MAYNVNIPARKYSSTFGGIPGAIDLPDPLADLVGVSPAIPQRTTQAMNLIGSQMAGDLDPTTLAALQDEAARWGLTSGVTAAPGGMGAQRGFWNTIRSKEAQRQLGLQNYGSLLPVLDQTMTLDPGLQASIADRNAMYEAAPVPQDATQEMRRWFMQSRGNSMGGGGNPGGGTRSSMTLPAGLGSSVGSGYGVGTPQWTDLRGGGGVYAPGPINPGGGTSPGGSQSFSSYVTNRLAGGPGSMGTVQTGSASTPTRDVFSELYPDAAQTGDWEDPYWYNPETLFDDWGLIGGG